MNTSESINLAFFLDKDNSPFILFDHRGTIRYLNDAAEILLAYTDKHELYDLALAYAPQDFGSQTTPMELHYRQLNFYAITVAYENEEYIGIRLYYRPRPKALHRLDTKQMKRTNIHTILEAAIALFAMQNPTPFDLFTDTDIPEFNLDQNAFSMLLRKSLNLFRDSDDLHLALNMAVGESIIIEHKRHPIVRLVIRANGRFTDDDPAIESLAESMRISATFEAHRLLFDIPFIQM